MKLPIGPKFLTRPSSLSGPPLLCISSCPRGKGSGQALSRRWQLQGLALSSGGSEPQLDDVISEVSSMGIPHSSVCKESACRAGDLGSIHGLARSPGDGNGNPLQYSCLENPTERGAWWAEVHGVSRFGHDLATKSSPPPPSMDTLFCSALFLGWFMLAHEVSPSLGQL